MDMDTSKLKYGLGCFEFSNFGNARVAALRTNSAELIDSFP